MGKQYGTYTEVECRKDATSYEKYLALKDGMERLIKKIVPNYSADFGGEKPDYDTMRFIVHESWKEEIVDPFVEGKAESEKKEFMTIAVKWKVEEKNGKTD